MHLIPPYALFLADAKDALAAKTATGIYHWKPEWCVAQVRLSGCAVSLDLPDVSIAEAAALGAKTLVIGVANRGGVLGESWVPYLLEALNAGMHLASGLHDRLTNYPALVKRAAELGLTLTDVRYPDIKLSPASGEKRSGKRLLTVGTDCSAGKMFTSLAIAATMKKQGRAATFRATGQTGIFIEGRGISVDAVIADFISGAIEWLAPENEPEHWDIIEGQGSLFHPSFAGVSLGLLHGAQPDALIMCHEPTRTTMRGVAYPLPSLQQCIEMNLAAAALTNPAVKLVGFGINTAALSAKEAEKYLAGLEQEFGLPAVDPVRHGVERLVDAL